ncbi:MAG TPA: TolC family protein [Anaeromyxobacteraceae bacterium]|jgi:outer membrane protein TolC|nr:TolC family protein [Anaeromyxobacteraceae bacterium]
MTVLAALLAALAAAAEPPSLTLEEALRALDGGSPTAAQARARAEQARAALGLARAPLLPSLTASGSYLRNSDSAEVPIGLLLSRTLPAGAALPAGLPTQLVIQPLEALSAAATLRVPLVVPSQWAELSSAGAQARSAGGEAEAVRQQLRAALVATGWAASAAEEIGAAAERALEAARAHAASARRAREGGTGTPLAQLQAETEAVRRESELVRARSEVERTRLSLGVLLGRDGPVRVAMGEPPPAAALDPASLRAEARARRPELRAAEAAAEASRAQLTAAHLRWLPTLAASGSAFASDVAYPTGKKEGWRATLELGWNLFDGGGREAAGARARAALSEAEAGARRAELEVGEQVEDAVRDVLVARERLGLATRERALAAETRAIAQRAFAGGAASSLDLLDASDRLYQAEAGLAQARAGLGAAHAALDRAVGRI